jgi:hypothetical protein
MKAVMPKYYTLEKIPSKVKTMHATKLCLFLRLIYRYMNDCSNEIDTIGFCFSKLLLKTLQCSKYTYPCITNTGSNWSKIANIVQNQASQFHSFGIT